MVLLISKYHIFRPNARLCTFTKRLIPWSIVKIVGVRRRGNVLDIRKSLDCLIKILLAGERERKVEMKSIQFKKGF